ncbi:hypothetical protein PAXINDRAFT_87553, partial [Paxillus involutus ATCC 200175]
DSTVTPKTQKIEGSSAQCKASDFDTITREVLNVAISVFWCLICTKAPFPESASVESQLAKDSWREACQRTNIKVNLTPPLMSSILKQMSHVRGELKTKLRSLVGPFFGFRACDSREGIKRNCDLVEHLKEGSHFAYVVRPQHPTTYIYKSDLLQLAINEMWFANRHDEGVIYHRYFNPIPTTTMALLLAVIKCCIDEWATGIKSDIKFTAAVYATVYKDHLVSLNAFDRHTAAYDLLGQIQQTLHDNMR